MYDEVEGRFVEKEKNKGQCYRGSCAACCCEEGGGNEGVKKEEVEEKVWRKRIKRCEKKYEIV